MPLVMSNSLIALASCHATPGQQVATPRQHSADGGESDAADARSSQFPVTVERGQRIDWKAWLQPPRPERPQPKLVCRQTRMDAGDVWVGQMVAFGWDITNAGEAPLHVKTAALSPG